MNNIMLDLETMGVAPYGAIIAIGAVKFNDEKVTDRFYEVVDLKSSVDAGLEIRPDTVMWWLQQDTDARSAFKEEGLPLIYALSRFHVWAGEDPIVWGDGSMFDNAIIVNAFEKSGYNRDIKKDRPWSYRNDRCYRTLRSLRPDIEIKRVGTYHNAVDDAESQANHLIEILKAISGDNR